MKYPPQLRSTPSKTAVVLDTVNLVVLALVLLFVLGVLANDAYLAMVESVTR